MKIKTALEIGQDCGLDMVSECLSNIKLHAISIFDYTKIESELEELYQECQKYHLNYDTSIETALCIIDNYNPCLYCDCWDSDREGCTMPSVDRNYACEASNNKRDHRAELNVYDDWMGDKI